MHLNGLKQIKYNLCNVYKMDGSLQEFGVFKLLRTFNYINWGSHEVKSGKLRVEPYSFWPLPLPFRC